MPPEHGVVVIIVTPQARYIFTIGIGFHGDEKSRSRWENVNILKKDVKKNVYKKFGKRQKMRKPRNNHERKRVRFLLLFFPLIFHSYDKIHMEMNFAVGF